eukprot:364965-Chlamydomonas_euryale.AAC.2
MPRGPQGAACRNVRLLLCDASDHHAAACESKHAAGARVPSGPGPVPHQLPRQQTARATPTSKAANSQGHTNFQGSKRPVPHQLPRQQTARATPTSKAANSQGRTNFQCSKRPVPHQLPRQQTARAAPAGTLRRA